MTKEEAINRIKAWNLDSNDREVLAVIIPELHESEDEEIRKGLINFLRSPFIKDNITDEKVAPWLAWLEKKKEQKSINLYDKIEELCSKYPINKYSMSDKELSAYHQGIHLGATKLAEYLSEQKSWEWREEERKILDSIIDDYEAAAKSFCGYDGKIGLLRALRDGEYNLPKPAWSDEDEKIVKSIINYLSYDRTQAILTVEIDKCIAWLKSLKSYWKPSDEQMEAFKKYIEEFQARAEAAVGGWNNFDVMIRLYEQLKKLQG